MNMRFNDKPVTMFSCLSVCQGQDGMIVDDKGSAVTFHAYMPADKNKMVYTFNAFDEARERVLKMNLQKGSRIMVVAVLKNYINKVNVCCQSFTVCLVDYLPADNEQLTERQDNKPVQQPQTPFANVRNFSGAAIASYQRPAPRQLQQPMQAVTPQKRPYSFEQPEVDIDEFANAIGGL